MCSSQCNVIGRGRVGSAIAARLAERGVACARRGGARAALRPRRRDRRRRARDRAGPLGRARQRRDVAARARLRTRDASDCIRCRRSRARAAPEQLDGAWAAVTAETDEARALGLELAATLGLQPFDLADEARPAYHAGAAIASNYLVTLHRAASRLFELAGAPPEALVPLMTRTIENGFELTGPIARGDWNTVDAHVRAIHEEAPELEPMYLALAEATRP